MDTTKSKDDLEWEAYKIWMQKAKFAYLAKCDTCVTMDQCVDFEWGNTRYPLCQKCFIRRYTR